MALTVSLPDIIIKPFHTLLCTGQRKVKGKALFEWNALALYFKMFTILSGRIGVIYMRIAMKTLFLGLTKKLSTSFSDK